MTKTITLNADNKEDRIKALDFISKRDVHGDILTGIAIDADFDDYDYIFVWSANDTSKKAHFDIPPLKIYHALNIDDACRNAIGTNVWVKDGDHSSWQMQKLRYVITYKDYPFTTIHDSFQFMSLTDPEFSTP